MSALQLLATALSIIEPPGRGYRWCQGAHAANRVGMAVDPCDETARRWDVLGAIYKADRCRMNQDLSQAAREAIELLHLFNEDISLPAWNDQPGRTPQQVVALLKRAIRHARRAAG